MIPPLPVFTLFPYTTLFRSVIFGVTFAKGITALIGMPSVIKLWAVAAGLIVSASVGVFFGVYPARDRKSTRLNSSHSQISYAVFCLKKKKAKKQLRMCISRS